MSAAQTGKNTPKPGFELGGRVSGSALGLRATVENRQRAANPNIDRIITAKMDTAAEQPAEGITEAAETYHRAFRRNQAERRLTLQQMYAELGQPGDLITLLFCSKFMPLFENWLASCRTHGIEVHHRLIVFTLDERAHSRTLELGVKSCFLNPQLYGEAGGSAGFADRKFSRTMFYKNAVINELLELGANVLFQDVDVIWLKDPLDYLAHAARDADVCFMYDGPNPHHRPLHANTGFFYVNCTAASKALFETAQGNTAAIFATGSHQIPLNRILAHFAAYNVLTVKVLPESEFLNGHLFNLRNGLSPKAENWRAHGYVMHYSWTYDMLEKRQKIEQFGLDYMPGDGLLGVLGVE